MAIINNVQLSNSEFQLRKGLYQVTGQKSSDDAVIFNTLAEEKMLFAYASENNLLPVQSEVIAFIQEEKDNYNQDAETKKMVDTFCSAANLSVDQYWNTYEYYNAYRVVTFNKIFSSEITNAVKEKKVRALDANNINLNSDILKEQYNYYNQFKMKIKSQVKVEIEKSYENGLFSFDASKLYLQ